jgi:hypothetical protein
MKKILLALSLSSILISSSAYSEGLKITPGMWETTMVSTNSMTGTTTQTTSNCMADEEFDPKTMVEEAEGCEITDKNLDGNTLTFTMACNMQGADAIMKGVYSVNGDQGEGSMNMEMSFGGQTMTMENAFTAKRIGDC